MPQPRLSRTVADLQAKRGDASTSIPAPKSDVPTEELFANGVELRSILITATDTTEPSPESSKEPSTSVSSTSRSSSETTAPTLPLSTRVQEYQWAARPVPSPDLSSPGGAHLQRFSDLMGVSPESGLELVLGWAYRVSYNWGEKSLEDLLLFHRDNCGFPKE